MSQKISIADGVFSGLITLELDEVKTGGTPSQKIEALLGYPKKAKEGARQLQALREKVDNLALDVAAKNDRIKELERVNENLLNDRADPDKAKRLELDREIFEQRKKEFRLNRTQDILFKRADLETKERAEKYKTLRAEVARGSITLDGEKLIDELLGTPPAIDILRIKNAEIGEKEEVGK